MIPLRELRLCRAKDCNNYFKPKTRQIYCGSIKLKIGCAYKNRLALNVKWNKNHPEIIHQIAQRHYFKREKPKRLANRDEFNKKRRDWTQKRKEQGKWIPQYKTFTALQYKNYINYHRNYYQLHKDKWLI